MKKKIIIGGCLLLIIIAFLLFSPYNLYHHFTAEEKVKSIIGLPMIREEILGNDSEIANVNYLGNNIYQVETEDNSFLVIIKSPNSYTTSVEVFEHKQHVTQIRD